MRKRPAKRQLIINLNIATARDIAVPPKLLTRADDVIAADAQAGVGESLAAAATSATMCGLAKAASARRMMPRGGAIHT